MKNDTISRAAAIDAVNNMIRRKFGISADLGTDALEALPPAQPTGTNTVQVDDCISRKAAIDVLAEAMPSLTTPDGCGQFDHDIQVTDEAYIDCMRIIHDLPSAQPSISKTEIVGDAISRQAAIKAADSIIERDTSGNNDVVKAMTAWKEYIKGMPPAQQWIPVTDRLPEMTDTYIVQVGINENGEGMHMAVRTAEWNVIWQTWYVHTTQCFVGDIIKWMPIPREGGQDNG